jgi:hypothetical protein
LRDSSRIRSWVVGGSRADRAQVKRIFLLVQDWTGLISKLELGLDRDDLGWDVSYQNGLEWFEAFALWGLIGLALFWLCLTNCNKCFSWACD